VLGPISISWASDGLVDFEGRALRDIGSELRTQSCHVVGEEGGVVAGGGDGDVAETGVVQVWVNAGIGVKWTRLAVRPRMP
jgi:hypothetical protein